MLKRLLEIIRHPASLVYPNTYSQQKFQAFLKSHGVTIGENTRFINPTRSTIDVGRGDYITIGKNCCLSEVTIIAHDYSWYTFLDAFDDVLPDGGGRIEIGNNCFVGYQACILKNTHIGNNVVIGARSVVKGDIPSNTVWAGIPARQICTLEQFYEKKLSLRIKDAVYRREHIKMLYHRNPTIDEMGAFSVLFLSRTEENYGKYLKKIETNGVKDSTKLREYFFKTTPLFENYEAFLNCSEE